MRITEARYHHWKNLRAQPNLTVLMSRRIWDCVEFIDGYFRPDMPFGVYLAMLGYSNQLDGPYHRINGIA